MSKADDAKVDVAVNVLQKMNNSIQNDIREYIEEKSKSADITRYICAAEGEMALHDILPNDENTKRRNIIKIGLYAPVDLYAEIWKFHPKVNRMILDHVDSAGEMDDKEAEESINNIVRETRIIVNGSMDLRRAVESNSVVILEDPEEVEKLLRIDILRDAAGKIITGAAPMNRFDRMYNEELDHYEEEERKIADNRIARVGGRDNKTAASGADEQPISGKLLNK